MDGRVHSPAEKATPSSSDDKLKHYPERFAMFVYGGIFRKCFRSLKALGLGLLCAGILAAPVFALPPKYFDVLDATLTTDSGEITAKLAISVDNVAGLYAMLKDGASVELLVTAKLERERTFWTNATLAAMDLVSTLQHNPLTREFALYMPGAAAPMLDRNLDRLLAATWQKYSVTFGPTSILDGANGTRYRVVLTLKLQHAKPPPWLAKDFMLWSKTIVEPETITLPFRH